MNGLLNITVTGDPTDAHVPVRTDAGHEFTLPTSVVPATCGPGGCFPLDLHAVTEAPMPDGMRHRMSHALINELLAVNTA